MFRVRILYSLSFIVILMSSSKALAVGEGFGSLIGGYHYIDGGSIYSDVTIPKDVAKTTNYREQEQKNIVNVSNKMTMIKEEMDLAGLKKGESSRTNILRLIEVGDAGILKAAKNGRIHKIHYIEVTREKLYVPMGFIPVYFNRYITTVYGE